MEDINSAAFFKLIWTCWVLLGAAIERFNFKASYMVYAIAMNTMVTLLYPIHLIIFLFTDPSPAELMRCLAVCVISSACSLKFVIFVARMRKVNEFEGILKELDARIESPDERSYFKRIGANMRRVSYTFLIVYLMVCLSAELSFIYRKQRNLLYPAWLPFDWNKSNKNFYIANAYQFIGVALEILQNFTTDCFPSMALCLLEGHTKLIGMRVAKIGYDSKSEQENEAELRRCIADQKNLYRLLDIILDIISWPLFIQFTVTAFDTCAAIVMLLFYVKGPFETLYHSIYLFAMPLQIFPVCYYGSIFQSQFDELPYDLFRCNWVDQSRRFKKHMIIFCERSRKPSAAYAGRILRIHLNTFYTTCKGGYSLFTVIMKMKK